MKKNKRVTMRDISEVSGYSVGTISLALNGSKKLPKETIVKIKKIAKRMGYRLDPMLSSLSTYRWTSKSKPISNVIAWIDPTEEGMDQMSCLTYAQYWKGASRRANEMGYKLDKFYPFKKGMTEEKIIKILKSRGVHGVILSPDPKHKQRMLKEWGQFSVMRIGFSLVSPRFHVVTSSQTHNAIAAMFRMMERGCQRIGFLSVVPKRETDIIYQNYLAGYLVALNRLALPSIEPLRFLNHSVKPNLEAFREWVETNSLDTVFAYNCNVERFIKESGLKASAELKYGKILDVYEENAPCSGISENNYKIGAATVDQVVGLLSRGEKGIPEEPYDLLIGGTWVDGNTC